VVTYKSGAFAWGRLYLGRGCFGLSPEVFVWFWVCEYVCLVWVCLCCVVMLQVPIPFSS
jgi:hypothetical protein